MLVSYEKYRTLSIYFLTIFPAAGFLPFRFLGLESYLERATPSINSILHYGTIEFGALVSALRPILFLSLGLSGERRNTVKMVGLKEQNVYQTSAYFTGCN